MTPTPPSDAARELAVDHYLDLHDSDCPKDNGVQPPRCNEPCSCGSDGRTLTLARDIDSLVASKVAALEKRVDELQAALTTVTTLAVKWCPGPHTTQECAKTFTLESARAAAPETRG